MLRPATFLFLLLTFGHAFAQKLQGSLIAPGTDSGYIVLWSTKGSHHARLDSALVGKDGRFSFRHALTAAGFYQLSVHDSDRVDLILDPREPLVDVSLSGLPLQEHILVNTSDENKRLWEYKLVSREAQAVATSAAQEKLGLQPDDTQHLAELDSAVARANRMRGTHLMRLVTSAPDSYFATIIRADMAVDAAQDKGPMAVVNVFDFGAPSLLRTSVYDKAIMTFLRNLNAVSEEQFVAASDTLMRFVARDPDCKAYMLDHLIELFSTYGPEMALQHLIDAYVAPMGSSAALDPALRAKVADLLKVSVNAIAPDLTLNDHERSFQLSSLVPKQPYTVLFFYSSTCDHCHAEMPGLKEDYVTFHPKGLEVVGIALDADSADFKASIADNGIPWQCYSEFIGWGAVTAKTYQVKATPSFFLLDDYMRIVAKPYDEKALREELNKRIR